MYTCVCILACVYLRVNICVCILVRIVVMPFGKTARNCPPHHYRFKKSDDPEGFRNGRRIWVPKRGRASGGVPPSPANAFGPAALPVEETVEAGSSIDIEDETPSDRVPAEPFYVLPQTGVISTTEISPGFRPCVDVRQISTGAVLRVRFDSGATDETPSIAILKFVP